MLVECFAFAAAVGFLLVMLRDLLFFGRATMTHDTILWVYPIFTYLADGLLHGALPLWNPFSRGGEPLLPSYLQTRLFDPIDYAVIYIGALFTDDLTTLFNWDRTMRMLAGALGTHLLLRRWARHLVTRIVLAFVCVMSSMTLNIFHQCGLNDQYYCAPFAAIFVFRILEGHRSSVNWLAGLFFLGSSLQSYFFVGSLTLILTILVGYAFSRRSRIVAVLHDHTTWIKVAASIVLLGVMAGPSLIMVAERDTLHMSARTLPPVSLDGSTTDSAHPLHEPTVASKDALIMMPYQFIRATGTPSRPADFLGLLAPKINDIKNPNGTNPSTRMVKGSVWSDSRMFLGGLVFAVCLLGLVSARSPFKSIWLLILGIFGFVMLGAYTPVHQALYQVYPPLWVIRHTQQLTNFFLLALLFFFVIGCDHLIASRKLAISLKAAPRYWWPIRSTRPSLMSFAERHTTGVFLSASIFVILLLLNAHAIVTTTLNVSASATVGLLAVGLIACLTLWVLAQFLAGQNRTAGNAYGLEPPGLAIAWPSHLLNRLGLFVCILLAALLAFHGSTYHDVALIPGAPASLLINTAAAIALCYVGFAIVDRALCSQEQDPAGQSNLAWNTTRSHFFWRLRRAVSRNRLLTFALVLMAAALASDLVGESERIVSFLEMHVVTLHGENFVRCIWILGAAAIVQSFALSARMCRSPLVHDFVPIAVAITAATVTLYISFTLPNPDAGMRTDKMVIDKSVQPSPTNLRLVLSILVFANLSLAAFASRRLFAIVFVISLTLAGSAVVASPENLLTHVTLFILLPAVCALLILRHRVGRWRRRLIATGLILVTGFELGTLAHEYRPDIEVSRETVQSNWSVGAGGIAFPDTRIAAIPSPPYSLDSQQPVRFAELLSRQGTAFGTPQNYPSGAFDPSVAEIMSKPRWNTFFTLKSYNDFTHANLPADVVEAVFGIGGPIAVFRPNARKTSDFAADIASLAPDQRLPALETTVFLDSATLPPDWREPVLNATHPRSAVRIASLDFDGITVKVRTDTPGYVYLADSYSPDWTAMVNDVAVPVLRANGNFKAVAIGAGDSEITFSYRPWRLIWAIRAYLAALLLCALMPLVGLFLQRRHGRSVPSRASSPGSP